MRLGVLGSGSGSNFAAILEAIERGELDAEIALVLSDQPSALILTRAERAGVPNGLIDCSPYQQKFPEEAQEFAVKLLTEAEVDLVVLAGFMRLVGPPLLRAFPNRILNVHPSLLPAFPGLEAWKQALEAGAETTGCTVHLVDEGMDTGAIVAQTGVPIFPEDSAKTLHARIQEAEHALYPSAISEVLAQLR